MFCVSYLRKTIEDYFEDGKRFGVNVEYAISNKPLSTAGQLNTAEEFIDDTSWNEKPEIKANVNIGCYVIDPKV